LSFPFSYWVWPTYLFLSFHFSFFFHSLLLTPFLPRRIEIEAISWLRASLRHYRRVSST
jgi:hypothetical protein